MESKRDAAVRAQRDEAEHALKQARRASKRGDLAGAERWSKAAERIAQTAERLAALPIDPPDAQAEAEEAEALRAELRRRLARYCEAAVKVQEWEAQGDPKAPYTDDDLTAIAEGELR